MDFKSILLLLTLSFSGHSADFLFGLFHQSFLTLVQEQSNLMVFDDGTYVLNMSTGDFGICHSDSQAGSFRGKLSKKELKKIKELLSLVDQECRNISDCKRNTDYEEGIAKWSLRDYTQKNKDFSFYEQKPELINYISQNINRYKEIPLRSLRLKINAKNAMVALNYEGSETYKAALGINNFIVLEKDGSLSWLNSFKSKESRDNTKVVTFSNSDNNQESLKLPIELKEFQKRAKFLIYTNKVDAHHLDPKRKLYSPCVKIQ